MFSLKHLARKGLTHWGRVTHICMGNLTAIGLDNGLSPGPRQAIIEPMLEYCWLDPYDQISVKSQLYIFIQENASKYVVWKMTAILSWP